MSEKAFRTGKCPKCMEELTVPEDLASFSCMYCGARLSQDDVSDEGVSVRFDFSRITTPTASPSGPNTED